MSYVLFVVYITNEDVIDISKEESTKSENNEPVIPVNNTVGNNTCINSSTVDCQTDAVPETPKANDHTTEKNPLAIPTPQESSVDACVHSATANDEEVTTGNEGGDGDSLDAKKSKNHVEFHRSDSELAAGKVKRFLSVHSLKQDVTAKLNQLDVKNAVWQKTHDNSLYQVSFIQESGQRCEQILDALAQVGVGRIAGSSVCVFPSSINIVKDLQTESQEEPSQVSRLPEDLDELSEEKKSEFKKSIKSRLVVNQVIESVQGNAQFTFDYLMLIILASLIAGMGLAENSSVVLVASMLISPLMGPIMAGVFGSVVMDNELRNLGLKSEIIGLCTCVVIGFLLGFITGGVGLNGAAWGSTDMWPTSEMATRGQWRSLWSGILIALPSGAGVALSVLGGNAGSLVGVAISASLLPPAVNAGMLWAYAVLAGFVPPQFEITNLSSAIQNESLINDTTLNSTVTSLPPNCAKFLNNAYVPIHSCNMATEAAILGAISLALTILNIFCIVVMGIVMLKIKAVVPTSATLQEEFFHTDMMIYRQSHSTIKGKKSIELGKMFCEEYKKLVKHKKDEKPVEEKTNKDPESCCPCFNFRSSQQEKDDRQVSMKNQNTDEDKEDDIISSVKMLFMREALEELEDSYEVKEILRQLPPGRSPVPMSSRLSLVFDEAETKFHKLLSAEAEHCDHQKTLTSLSASSYYPPQLNPYHTIHAFSSQAFSPLMYKFTPRTPQPDKNQQSERFIFPTKPLLRRRTYLSIPRAPAVALSTIDEGMAESEVDPVPRSFIVQKIKEEGNEPKILGKELIDVSESGPPITTVEEIPLLP